MSEKKSPALIQFTPGVLNKIDRYAKDKGISRNAAVNIACAELVEEMNRKMMMIYQVSAQALKDAESLRLDIKKLMEG